MFEHRNYLASFGVFLAVVVAMSLVLRRMRVLATIGVALLLFFAGVAWGQAQQPVPPPLPEPLPPPGPEPPELPPLPSPPPPPGWPPGPAAGPPGCGARSG